MPLDKLVGKFMDVGVAANVYSASGGRARSSWQHLKGCGGREKWGRKAFHSGWKLWNLDHCGGGEVECAGGSKFDALIWCESSGQESRCVSILNLHAFAINLSSRSPLSILKLLHVIFVLFSHTPGA